MLVEVGVGLLARAVVTGSGWSRPAGSGGVRDQKRMLAGPGWRVLAVWPGFLTW